MKQDSKQLSLNQQFGYVFGAIYAVVGVVGFAITPGVGFFSTHGKDLIFFGLNPFHNLIHIAVGVLFIVGAVGGAKLSSVINVLIGAVYLVVAILGLFIIGTSFNIIALNSADNVLHFVSAVAALGVGLFGRKSVNALKSVSI